MKKLNKEFWESILATLMTIAITLSFIILFCLTQSHFVKFLAVAALTSFMALCWSTFCQIYKYFKDWKK